MKRRRERVRGKKWRRRRETERLFVEESLMIHGP